MARRWTTEDVLEIARGFQPACVLAAGAELDVFSALTDKSMTADELAAQSQANPRAMAMLTDALTAMELLTKQDDRYALAPGVAEVLTEAASQSALAMVRHQANCLRSWAQLAKVVRAGERAERTASIRGPQADLAAFIEAMNEISRSIAPELVEAIGPPPFTRLLDVGGGPGTWTIAFLRAQPDATATLFDLPDVIPIGRKHIVEAGLEDRVELVAGDFDVDEKLPAGADLAWVGAIVHMNSRQENRSLFAKVHAALVAGGRILIRDVVMDESRVSPADGAMFAVNMLVNTPGGSTYSFGELSEDLIASGFADPVLLRRGQFMDSVIQAEKASRFRGPRSRPWPERRAGTGTAGRREDTESPPSGATHTGGREKQMKEKRAFTRVDYDADATLEYEGEEFPSRIVRLSLKGVLINTGASPRKGDNATVRFSADIGDEPVTLHCSGRVIRADRRGVGLEFEGVDLDTFKQLRDIVAANSSDPSVIVEEFEDFIRRWEERAEGEEKPAPPES